jgi:hypothetical protein
MAASVPANAAGLAGVDLEAVRRSPLLAAIPAPERAFLDSFGGARTLLVAIERGELLMIAQGSVAGWTPASGGVSLNGAPGLIAEATAHHAPSPVLGVAEALARTDPVWAVVRGNTVLPLSGNLANLNNLLRDVDYLTLAAQLSDRVSLDLTASCPTLEAARHFEGSVRAVLAVSTANVRQADVAGLLKSAQVRREDRTVHVALAAAPQEILRLLH